MLDINKDSFSYADNRNKRRNKMCDTFMKSAILFSNMSTCARIKVGAVLVKNSRIISTGFNGVAPGMLHCDDYFLGREVKKDEHKEFSDKFELHAEVNLLMECAKNEISPSGSTLFVTISPCNSCSKMILAAGIKEVYYLEKYDREDNGLKLLTTNGVRCQQYYLEK
jgi:dCMP deaminase